MDLVSSSNLEGEIVQYSARSAVFIERASEDIVADERNLGEKWRKGSRWRTKKERFVEY